MSPWTRRAVVPTTHTCPRCHVEKPRTEAFFYFSRNPERRGQLTGFCRICQNEYCRTWNATRSRRPHYARDWRRRTLGTPPATWRQHPPMASA